MSYVKWSSSVNKTITASDKTARIECPFNSANDWLVLHILGKYTTGDSAISGIYHTTLEDKSFFLPDTNWIPMVTYYSNTRYQFAPSTVRPFEAIFFQMSNGATSIEIDFHGNAFEDNPVMCAVYGFDKKTKITNSGGERRTGWFGFSPHGALKMPYPIYSSTRPDDYFVAPWVAFTARWGGGLPILTNATLVDYHSDGDMTSYVLEGEGTGFDLAWTGGVSGFPSPDNTGNFNPCFAGFCIADGSAGWKIGKI